MLRIDGHGSLFQIGHVEVRHVDSERTELLASKRERNDGANGGMVPGDALPAQELDHLRSNVAGDPERAIPLVRDGQRDEMRPCR